MASFRKHSNGTWEYRIRYKDPINQKFKEKSKRGFFYKKEAQLAAAETEKRILMILNWIITPTILKIICKTG